MKINVICASEGLLVPISDDDYENKKRLKTGNVYCVDIAESRNYKFLKKYHALINLAWDYLPEDWVSFFGGNKTTFRHAVETAAGSFELVYDIKNNTWVQSHRSINFSSMKESEFSEIYGSCLDVLSKTFLKDIDINKFNNILNRFS